VGLVATSAHGSVCCHVRHPGLLGQGIATVYGVILARRFGLPEVVEGKRASPVLAVITAVVFGAGLAGSAAIGVALGWTEPAWVPLPVLTLVLYELLGKRERIQQKAVGTALGAVAAVGVAFVVLPTWALTLLASTAFLLGLLVHKRSYATYYGLYTFALILALSAPGNVGTEAAHRGTETLIGIGILVVGLALLDAFARWLAKRYPEPITL
jgi:uncharacterized membrane protein YccC